MLTDKQRRLTVQLEGAEEDGGAIRLDELGQFVQQLIQTLAAVESEIVGRDRRTTIYRVVGLSYSSPAHLELEAVAPPGQTDIGPIVVSRFANEVKHVNRGEEPEGIEATTLEIMQGLSAGYRKHLRSIQFHAENETIPIPTDFDAKIKKLLGNVNRSRSTIRGKLDAVNLHATPTIFIYPLAGPSKIRCTYPRGKFPHIGLLLETMVDVRGVMKYRGDSPHPYEIEVEEIIPLLDKAHLPTTDEIVGSMPNLTGEDDVVTYLRKLRDEETA